MGVARAVLRSRRSRETNCSYLREPTPSLCTASWYLSPTHCIARPCASEPGHAHLIHGHECPRNRRTRWSQPRGRRTAREGRRAQYRPLRLTIYGWSRRCTIHHKGLTSRSDGVHRRATSMMTRGSACSPLWTTARASPRATLSREPRCRRRRSSGETDGQTIRFSGPPRGRGDDDQQARLINYTSAAADYTG